MTENNNLRQDLDKLVVSGPADCGFELHVLNTGIGLVDNLLNDKYATSLEHDLSVLD